ncbi:ABC transporter substrate-binding protein [soil metagenome]
MKTISFLALIILCGFGILNAQTFDEGLEQYENQNFLEAAEIFSALDDDQSLLFAGKSYFGLQNYVQANEYLRKVAEESDTPMFRQEATYTMALSYFRMKNITRSLELLYELAERGDRGRVRVDAQRFYRQVMRYLSIEQRFNVLNQTNIQQIAKDIVVSSSNYVNHLEYETLVDGFLNRITNSDERSQLKEELTRSPSDQARRLSLTPPDGMVYNVGVVLPADENSSPDLLVPRNLYYGITLAAEEFNSLHAEKKIFLKFKNSHHDPDSTAKAFKDLVWNGHVDVVIGPLFSEPAITMSKLAQEYRVPMIAPLANSDEININHNYTFQMNPTFAMHGRMMARHAVQTLNLDTLAVITQRDALGTASAHSFRREAERLGSYISYFIEEDFSAVGYDLTNFTEVFTTDPAEIEENNFIPTQGIYAPFTGQAASTLINLLMTDLEVLRSNIIVMGSEEWENANLSNWQNRNFEIYYTRAFGENTDSSEVAYFKQDFETRFGIEPDRFAKIGYDVGTYIFRSLSEAGNPAYLGKVLMNRDFYEGIELSIEMDQERINQHLFIRPLSQSAIERQVR